jgi:hypothetical protein
MKFIKLSPNVFYADIKIGLKLFVQCLEFTITYDDLNADEPFCVIEKDGLGLHLIQSKEFADKDRPEMRLETNNIEAVYDSITKRFPELLHPNSKNISLKPWGAKEFALKDESDVCIIIQQWNSK